MLVTDSLMGVGVSQPAQEPDPFAQGSSPALVWLSGIQSVPVEQTPISTIRSGLLVREDATNTDHVQALVESIAELPAIIVHRPTMNLIDGAHRLAAVRALGRESIGVRFFDGSDDDAYALAVCSNIGHGLPLSVSERKAAAIRLMCSHPSWSDRLIARTAGLSHKTVGVLRRRTSGAGTQSDSRVGSDGKVRPMDADKGRRIAADIIRDRPGASLREVSKLAGISPSTVADVRERLSRGESPMAADEGTGSAAGRIPANDLPPTQKPGSNSQVSPTTPSQPGMRQLRGAVITLQGKLLKSLQNDPALRFNEKGRSILRHVAASVNEIVAWQKFAGDSPTHCNGTLARVARANAQSWTDLAEHLERLERADRATG
ncbi:ParB/RepB/Spo0J family partition protein [Nocardia vinacea]|uniref:ParB/RepB/Spo0J family partition protein n=1 Tax=Nocardia vinacea TaxID=96468 RepID=UPI0033F76CB6